MALSLDNLIKRLECCPPEGDRELDCHLLIRRDNIADGQVVLLQDGDAEDAAAFESSWMVLRVFQEPTTATPLAVYFEAPRFTSSVDAAMTIAGGPWMLSCDAGRTFSAINPSAVRAGSSSATVRAPTDSVIHGSKSAAIVLLLIHFRGLAD